jgi:hypothetical protein
MILDRLTTYCSGKEQDGVFEAEEALELVKNKKAENKSVK